jgi:hypothetical protein
VRAKTERDAAQRKVGKTLSLDEMAVVPLVKAAEGNLARAMDAINAMLRPCHKKSSEKYWVLLG